MRVEIDEAGGDERARRIEHPAAVEAGADLGDDAVDDAHVGVPCRCAGAVDHAPALDHVLVEHAVPPFAAAVGELPRRTADCHMSEFGAAM